MHNSRDPQSGRRPKMMERLGINLVLDVGANDGEYALDLRKSGYRGRIWSYEATARGLSRTWLTSAAMTNCGRRSIAHAGQKPAASRSMWRKIVFRVRCFRWLMYALKMPRRRQYTDPQETVSVCTLDDSVMASLSSHDQVWLKIDTQGYEAEVLKGASRLMPYVKRWNASYL